MLEVKPEGSMLVVAIIRSGAISDVPIGAVSAGRAGKDAPRPRPDRVGSDRGEKYNADVKLYDWRKDAPVAWPMLAAPPACPMQSSPYLISRQRVAAVTSTDDSGHALARAAVLERCKDCTGRR
jgi:hypothetical protein